MTAEDLPRLGLTRQMVEEKLGLKLETLKGERLTHQRIANNVSKLGNLSFKNLLAYLSAITVSYFGFHAGFDGLIKNTRANRQIVVTELDCRYINPNQQSPTSANLKPHEILPFHNFRANGEPDGACVHPNKPSYTQTSIYRYGAEPNPDDNFIEDTAKWLKFTNSFDWLWTIGGALAVAASCGVFALEIRDNAKINRTTLDQLVDFARKENKES